MLIPRVLHFIWVDGSPPMPERFREFVREWGRLHRDWDVRLWTRPDGPLVNQDLYDRAHKITPGSEGQLRSDIWRYEILRAHGGVYVDVDFEPLKPLDSLLEDVECFAAWEIQGQVANNAIMGATPGHPLFERLVADLPERVARHPKRWPAQMTGPHYLTSRLTPDVTVFDRAMFYAIGCTELNRLGEPYGENEWARHYWNNQHRKKNRPLPGEIGAWVFGRQS